MKKWLLIFSFIVILNGAFPLISYSNFKTQMVNIRQQKLRETIKSVMQDPRFQYYDFLGWLEKVIRKAVDFLDKTPKSREVNLKNKTVETILKWLGLAIVALLPFILVFFGNRFLSRNLPSHQKNSRIVIGKAEGADELKKASASMAQTGQYREAVRYLYRAGLEKLREENILPFSTRFSDKENTRLLKKTLGGESPGYLAFARLVVIFQEKWYGLKLCDEGDYLQAKGALETLWARIGKSDVT